MPLPEIKHCLICEDIRIEQRNLASYMGVYGATPHVGIRILNFDASVTFFLVFMGAPSEGKYIIQLELRAPDGTRLNANVFPENNEQTFSPQFGSSVFAFRVVATFPGPNIYTVALLSNGVVFFEDTLQLVQAAPADFK